MTTRRTRHDKPARRPDEPREVAAAYLTAEERDPATEVAFAQLVTETDQLFRWITQPGRPNALQVFFTTCVEPLYRDTPELITSVAEFAAALEITTVAVDRYRRHPLMSNDLGGEYDRSHPRSTNPSLGHARMQLGFDRDGEFTVWRAQERFHSQLARRALATELHGQHSVRWTTGEIAVPKAVLLNEALLNQTAAARRRANRRAAVHTQVPSTLRST